MDDDCRQFVDQLELYLDGECPGDIELIVQAHLRQCPPCLDRADFERHLRVLIASRCRERAPAGLLERVLIALERSQVVVEAPELSPTQRRR